MRALQIAGMAGLLMASSDLGLRQALESRPRKPQKFTPGPKNTRFEYTESAAPVSKRAKRRLRGKGKSDD